MENAGIENAGLENAGQYGKRWRAERTKRKQQPS